MVWNRDKLEEYLASAFAAAGTDEFSLIVPESDMGAVLMQLRHLKKLGRMTDYRRREAQEQTGRDDCVNVYGYIAL